MSEPVEYTRYSPVSVHILDHGHPHPQQAAASAHLGARTFPGSARLQRDFWSRVLPEGHWGGTLRTPVLAWRSRCRAARHQARGRAGNHPQLRTAPGVAASRSRGYPPGRWRGGPRSLGNFFNQARQDTSQYYRPTRRIEACWVRGWAPYTRAYLACYALCRDPMEKSLRFILHRHRTGGGP